MSAFKRKRSVLITGCSDGGLGAALAIAFLEAGFHVYSTARNKYKMEHVAAQGIQTLELDVQSESSIANCVEKVPHLDILVNNAGTIMTMPISDTSIPQAKTMFESNFWGPLAVTKAFLPLIIESKGMIVNNTSIAASVAAPLRGAYGASKAALSMLTETLRLELGIFGVRVIELRTGIVGPTNLTKNDLTIQSSASAPILPQDSIYQPAKAFVEGVIRQNGVKASGMSPQVWAREVVQDLQKSDPPPLIWRGQSATTAWCASMVPHGFIDEFIKKKTQYNHIETLLKHPENIKDGGS